MELASVLIGVLPVLLVTALVLCYVCVLRRLCCDTVPHGGARARAGSSTGVGGGMSAGGGGVGGAGGPASASATSRTSVWCWWAEGGNASGGGVGGALTEEFQLTNTTTAFDSNQAPAAT